MTCQSFFTLFVTNFVAFLFGISLYILLKKAIEAILKRLWED